MVKKMYKSSEDVWV